MARLTDEERAAAAQTRGDAGEDDPGVRAAALALVTFPNAYPQRAYTVTVDCPEFTSVCPMTDQPDFGRVVIEYVPGKVVLELKSLKLYLLAYRNVGIFVETVTNTIREDLQRALEPRSLKVTVTQNARGGITTTVVSDSAS